MSELFVSAAVPFQPRFIRFPRGGGVDPFSGLTRSGLYSALKTGKVKSYTIKSPGTKRGVRLIDAESLTQFITSNVSEQIKL